MTSSKFSSSTVSLFDSFLLSLNSSYERKNTNSPTCVSLSLTSTGYGGSSFTASEAFVKLTVVCRLGRFGLRSSVLIWSAFVVILPTVGTLGSSIGVNTALRVWIF